MVCAAAALHVCDCVWSRQETAVAVAGSSSSSSSSSNREAILIESGDGSSGTIDVSLAGRDTYREPGGACNLGINRESRLLFLYHES